MEPTPQIRKAGLVFERHYTVQDLAIAWNISQDLVRDIFAAEERTLKITLRKKGKRRYVTLRIPESLAIEKYRQFTKGRTL